jgi:hypothetical protein
MTMHLHLRDYQAVLFCAQQVELERMADAAWLVNGCNVRHFGCLAKVQLQWYHGATMREASVAVERLSSSVGCIPSLSPNRASSRVAGTFELRTWEILGESTVTVANTFLRQSWLVSPIPDNCARAECMH